MNYEIWSKEYFLQADIIKKHLKDLKNGLKGKSASERKDINQRIAIIYPMYLELKHTGNFLKLCIRRDNNE